MRSAVLAAALLVGLALPTVARATGAYLGWDDCAGAGGSSVRTFACDGDDGSETFVGSFVPMSGISRFIALEVRLEIVADPASSLPSWWWLRNPGTCRQGALSSTWDFAGMPSACVDPWARLSTGGIASYETLYQGMPWRARLTVVYAMPEDSARAVDPATEYLGYRVTFDHSHTVGAGACAGCAQAVCIVNTSSRLYQPYAFDPEYHELVNPSAVPVLSWQATVPQCPGSVPARRGTWGAIKSLYR